MDIVTSRSLGASIPTSTDGTLTRETWLEEPRYEATVASYQASVATFQALRCQRPGGLLLGTTPPLQGIDRRLQGSSRLLQDNAAPLQAIEPPLQAKTPMLVRS